MITYPFKKPSPILVGPSLLSWSYSDFENRLITMSENLESLRNTSPPKPESCVSIVDSKSKICSKKTTYISEDKCINDGYTWLPEGDDSTCSSYVKSYLCEDTENSKKPDYLTDKQAQWYLDFYGDLKNAFGDDLTKAKIHWKSNGIREGRLWLKDDGGKKMRNLMSNVLRMKNVC